MVRLLWRPRPPQITSVSPSKPTKPEPSMSDSEFARERTARLHKSKRKELQARLLQLKQMVFFAEGASIENALEEAIHLISQCCRKSYHPQIDRMATITNPMPTTGHNSASCTQQRGVDYINTSGSSISDSMQTQDFDHQPHMEAEHICRPLAAAMSTCSPPMQLSDTKTSTPARAQTCPFISPLLASPEMPMQCVVHHFLLRKQPERDTKPRFEVDFLPGTACRKAASDGVVESAAVLFLMKHSRS